MARELAPAGLRSGPQISEFGVRSIFRAASRPSGSKLPRHKSTESFFLALPSVAPRKINSKDRSLQ
ncbi:hypothetical protein C1X48_02825 [Pseudomonas sp. FW305-3-2-15-A-R2A1]|nr:hypothetical protein C1X48_02825 [Pseudomonas sp. FW305-3-2-15-A-R2A1]